MKVKTIVVLGGVLMCLPSMLSAQELLYWNANFYGFEDLLETGDTDNNDMSFVAGSCAEAPYGIEDGGDGTADIDRLCYGVHPRSLGRGSVNSSLWLAIPVDFDESNAPDVVARDSGFGNGPATAVSTRALVPFDHNGYVAARILDDTADAWNGWGGFAYTEPGAATPGGVIVTEVCFEWAEPVTIQTDAVNDWFLKSRSTGEEIHLNENGLPGQPITEGGWYTYADGPGAICVPYQDFLWVAEREPLLYAYPDLVDELEGSPNPWYLNPNLGLDPSTGSPYVYTDPAPWRGLGFEDSLCYQGGGCLIDADCADEGEDLICFMGNCVPPGGCDPPVAICDNEGFDLQAGGTVTIDAEQIDDGSLSECGIDEFALGDETGPMADSWTFDCDDLGDNYLHLWVTDGIGQQSSCESQIVIRDRAGYCAYGSASGLNGLDVALKPNGLGRASFELRGSMFGADFDVRRVGSADDPQPSIILDCDDEETLLVELWFDTGGGADFIESYALLHDEDDLCGEGIPVEPYLPASDLNLACANGLVVELWDNEVVGDANGEATVLASAFDAGSFDSDTPPGELIFEVSLAGENDYEESITFTGVSWAATLVNVRLSDAQGNQSICETYVLVQKNTTPLPPAGAPTVIAMNGLAAELLPVDGGGGAVTLPASAFDMGTYDDTTPADGLTLGVRRVGDDNPPQPFIDLTCGDDASLIVELWATDGDDLSAFAETYVLVQDNQFSVCDP